MCVFAITWANSTIWETEKEKQDKEGVLLMVLAGLGNGWVRELRGGLSLPSLLQPQGPGGGSTP